MSQDQKTQFDAELSGTCDIVAHPADLDPERRTHRLKPAVGAPGSSPVAP